VSSPGSRSGKQSLRIHNNSRATYLAAPKLSSSSRAPRPRELLHETTNTASAPSTKQGVANPLKAHATHENQLPSNKVTCDEGGDERRLGDE
jgi:hypothetical protein